MGEDSFKLCTNNRRCTLTQKFAGRKPSTRGTRILATGLRALQVTGLQHKPSTPNNIIRNNIIRNNIKRQGTRCLAGSQPYTTRATYTTRGPPYTTRATGNGDPPPAGQRRWESNLTLLICRLVTMIANGNNMKPSSTIKAGECIVSQIILCHNQLQFLNRHRTRECFHWGRIMTRLGALVNLSEEIINLNQSLTTIPHLLVRWRRLITCTFRRSQC